jgi:hypothetical protein
MNHETDYTYRRAGGDRLMACEAHVRQVRGEWVVSFFNRDRKFISSRMMADHAKADAYARQRLGLP